jgi:cephalosporin-C deacetylase-like acetyl esterase
MFHLKRKGCFEATFRGGIGYYIDMLYMLVATNTSNNCVQKHAVTQTSWGGLSLYYKGYGKSTFQTWCVVPSTNCGIENQGIDLYVGLTKNCNDAEDKRFNFGKLLLFVCIQFV